VVNNTIVSSSSSSSSSPLCTYASLNLHAVGSVGHSHPVHLQKLTRKLSAWAQPTIELLAAFPPTLTQSLNQLPSLNDTLIALHCSSSCPQAPCFPSRPPHTHALPDNTSTTHTALLQSHPHALIYVSPSKVASLTPLSPSTHTHTALLQSHPHALICFTLQSPIWQPQHVLNGALHRPEVSGKVCSEAGSCGLCSPAGGSSSSTHNTHSKNSSQWPDLQ
jgi:hypothetical protein